jgi:hypothetical protein
MTYLHIITTTTLWLSCLVGYAQSADEKAITAVIGDETTAFYQRKADKALSYWANVPYASHTYSEKGSGYFRGYKAISTGMKQVLKRNPEPDKKVYKRHDFIIHVNSSSAWATYITDIVDGAKKKQSYDARYLEKINGTWKIVSAISKPAP